MAFQKGNKYSKGRPKGSKNKRSFEEVRNAITEYSNGENHFLIKAALSIFSQAQQKKDLKIQAYVVEKLFPYVYPKLNAVTVEFNDNESEPTSTPEQRKKYIEKMLKDKIAQ